LRKLDVGGEFSVITSAALYGRSLMGGVEIAPMLATDRMDMTRPGGLVAVGTAVARRPPHGSRRAELPHRALASGETRGRIYAAHRTRCRNCVSSVRHCVRCCAAPTGSHWLGSFPPSSPQPAAHRKPCSRTSRVLRTHPTSLDRASPSYPNEGFTARATPVGAVNPGTSRLPNRRPLPPEVPPCRDSQGVSAHAWGL